MSINDDHVPDETVVFTKRVICIAKIKDEVEFNFGTNKKYMTLDVYFEKRIELRKWKLPGNFF